MCGVFGFIANEGQEVDLSRLEDLAIVTESRGEHAWGVAWIDEQDRLRRFKRAGRVSDNFDLLGQVAGAKAVIGHCRFATHGDPRSNENNHPHPSDGGWIVHNGVVGNSDALQRQFGLEPSSECDSETLALMIEAASGSLVDRVASTVERAHGRLAVLGLWSRPQRLIVAKNGNPLEMGKASEGVYFASLREGLPAPVAVPEGSVTLWSVRNASIVNVKRRVAPCLANSRQLSRRAMSAGLLHDVGW